MMKQRQEITICLDASPDEIHDAVAYMNRYLLDLRLRGMGVSGNEYEECIKALHGQAPWREADTDHDAGKA